MIQPKSYKYICPKCEYSKIVKPKSDVVDFRDLNNVCPKCKTKMKKKELNIVDKIISVFK